MFWHSTSCCSSELDSTLHCIFCLCGFLVKWYPSVHHFNMFASYFLVSCTCVRGWKVGRLICTMKCCWNPTPLRMKMENLLKVLKPHATMHVFQRRLFSFFLKKKPFFPPTISFAMLYNEKVLCLWWVQGSFQQRIFVSEGQTAAEQHWGGHSGARKAASQTRVCPPAHSASTSLPCVGLDALYKLTFYCSSTGPRR